jgi:chromosome segregation ATPase
MSFHHRHARLLLVLALGALALAATATLRQLTAGPARADTPSLGQLGSELEQQQAHQRTLASSIAGLDGLISSLDSQIDLVRSREAAVRVTLARERSQLAAARAALARQRARLQLLRRRLHRAQTILADQLRSEYEGTRPDIVSVVLDAHGFAQLLERLSFLGRAERQQQSLIRVTRAAKQAADAALRRLSTLAAAKARAAAATATEARALAGMNALLNSREGALDHAREAQQEALAASRQRGARLQDSIDRIRAQQEAAAQAALLSSGGGPALGPSGGWAIPYAIVLCESGGQNLPPNSAGASGYYQILPGTWKLFGGTGPAAYLASKAEQDAVAARIWNGGAGASNWVCAGIVGIH